MQIYPAIDLKGGRVVRWLEGETVRETVYTRDPLLRAEEFVRDGATWIHVVDVDRAFGIGGDNIDWVRRIAALAGVRLQVGGNIHTLGWAREASAAGAARVVLGTAAGLDPVRFAALVKQVGPARCGLAVDVRDGRVALRDSSEPVADSTENLVKRALDFGVRTVVYRDLARDGLVVGADIKGAEQLVAFGADVIVAGGVSGLDDLRAASEAGVVGVIVGRALYEGRFTLQEAIECSR